jgi:hypothetical protein
MVSRPLVFLDVDGTLVASGVDRRGAPDAGRRLAALDCELEWATTWGERANTVIAPLLGLPRLAVVGWPELSVGDDLKDAFCGLHWKTRTLVDRAAGRAFAWVDDEITDEDRQWVKAHHPGPALLLGVDASAGLTDGDLTALEGWVHANLPVGPP